MYLEFKKGLPMEDENTIITFENSNKDPDACPEANKKKSISSGNYLFFGKKIYYITVII
ncbi:MAG: hypothetical protein ACM3S2_00265 [Ignavibacteriales bacterium]